MTIQYIADAVQFRNNMQTQSCIKTFTDYEHRASAEVRSAQFSHAR